MALQSRKVFVDSSILLPFVDRGDVNHQRSVKSIENLARLHYQLYISYPNIAEIYATLAGEVGISVALDFLQASLQSDMEIIFPTKADLIAAHRMIRSNKDRQLTLREAINATLMQRKGIIQILTFTYWHNLFGTYVTNLIQ